MEKMKMQRVESYDAGYGEGSSGNLKKVIAVSAAAAAMVGGLTGCLGIGDVCEPTYNGYMVVENVSDSDVSPSDSCASKDESLTLDGDVAYVSSEQV